MKVIAITGTPGTGKTALARELSLLLRYKYLGQSELLKHGIKHGISEGYDKVRRTLIVNPAKLNTVLVARIRALNRAKKAPKGLILDSHMSHFLPLRHVNLCVVTHCSLKTLKRRLEAKGYQPAKVRENLDAEIFDTCLVEALEKGHKVLSVDTARKSPRTLALAVRKALEPA